MEMSRAVRARNAGACYGPANANRASSPTQATGHLGIGVFRFGLLCGPRQQVTLAGASIPDQAFGTILNY